MTFKVRILRYPPDSRTQIRGKGELVVHDDVAVLTGKVPIEYLPYPPFARNGTRMIPLQDIANVVQDRREASFSRAQYGVTWPPIVLIAASQPEAARIAGLLPMHTTAEHAEQQEQQVAFTTALNAATPTAFVTPTIVGINLLVFVAMCIAGADWFAPSPEHMLAWGADHWPTTTSGQWWRLLTNTFLHFGLIHLALNMWALSSGGGLAERLYGNRFFAAIYLFGAVTSSLASIWWNQDAVVAGASGAIFAVYGATLAYLLFQPGSFPKGAVAPLLKSTLGFVAYNVFYGFAQAGISNSAHLGGLAGGFLMGMVVCRPLAPALRVRQRVPRALAGAVVGIAALCAGLHYLPKCSYDMTAEAAFLAEQQAIGAEEATAIRASGSLFEKAQAGELSDAEFAQRLDEEVTGRWEGMAGRMARIPVSATSPSKPLHDALVRFCQARRDAYRALGEGLRTGNEIKVEEFRSLMEKADGVIKEIEGPNR